MTQEIKYNGLSANPSDYESPDGDLTTALNLIPEDGQIKPLFQPHDVCTLPVGMIFIHIHKTSTFVHYIAYDPATKRLYWIDASEATGDTRLVREYIQALEYEVGDVVLHPEVGYIKFTAHHNAGAQLTGNEITTISTYPPTLNLIKVFDSGQTIIQVNSIGNTLVVLTNDGINYFLWKGNNEQYHYLGNHIPELPLSFGLQGKAVISSEFTAGSFETADFLHVPYSSNPKITLPWGSTTRMDTAITTLTNSVLGQVNKFIKEEATNKGKFIMPFFVCYAYRCYDGSLIMHSAPVLMVPNSGSAPQVYIASSTTQSNSANPSNSVYLDIKARVAAIVCDLDYACIDSNAKEALQEWGDIVKSVDIFISAPIYTYDQSGRIQGFEYGTFEEFTISLVQGYGKYISVNNGSVSSTDLDMLLYRKKEVAPLLDFDTNDNHYRFTLPTHTDEEVKNQINECCNFYFLKSINVDDIDCKNYASSTVVELPYRTQFDTITRDVKSTRSVIEIKDDYLEALTTREEMKMYDEVGSHDVLIPSLSYVYNQRLHLANIKKNLSMQFNPATFVPLCQPDMSNIALSQDEMSATISFSSPHNTDIYLRITQDSKTIVSKSPTCTALGDDAPFLYLYYPDINADNAVIVKEMLYQGVTKKNVITLPLKKHVNLNGAFFFEGWNPSLDETGWINPASVPSHAIPDVTADNSVPIPNKLYSSEINNPFYFPNSGIITIGTGTILGISSAAKALSQGQFGQFPLYAFCSDGVWALEVAKDGTFSARQPITRDVCVNPDSITQIDTAVLFATDRGIMHLSGSTATCITDVIATEYPFDILANLPHANDLHAMLGHDTDTCLPTQPFLTFLNGCRMVYDYLHQHILVYNPNYTYAYVFSLKSKLWGMTYSNLKSTLNSYPDALAMADGDKMVTFSSTDETVCKGLLVTRPIKLGDGNALKSIHTLLQRGFFHGGYVKTVLYGSRDLEHWHIIASSSTHVIRNLRGTPYKYFRIAAVATLTPNKSLHGATIDFETRHTNVIH